MNARMPTVTALGLLKCSKRLMALFPTEKRAWPEGGARKPQLNVKIFDDTVDPVWGECAVETLWKDVGLDAQS